MKNEEIIYQYIFKACKKQVSENKENCGCTTREVANAFSLQRTNVSAILNKLCSEGKILKLKSKPVLFRIDMVNNVKKEQEKKEIKKINNDAISFDSLIGQNKSLKKCVQQAKAAILYPPNGLHSLILGPTGVGKTLFAELMYRFAMEKGVISFEAPFISFNCADYANNPQLLLSHLFGSKKGAFTGADRDKLGIVDKANKGILFLDEVHRLPPEGQEMLFNLIDKGIYTSLGDIDNKKHSEVLIICATTEDVDSNLLATFTRRIPMTVNVPAIKDRTLEERFEIICEFFKIESKRIGKEITITSNVIRALLLYTCPGNIGQLKSDIQLACANAFLNYASKGKKNIEVHTIDLLSTVKRGLLFYKKNADAIDRIMSKDSKLKFNAKKSSLQIEDSDDLLPSNFYESIEKRINELKEHNVDDTDINFIMSFEIENYFTKYIEKFDENVNKEELSKVVDTKIICLVEEFLKTASEKLKRVFSTKVFYGLSLHVSSSIERLAHNGKIINHNLDEIITKYSEEYGLAVILANNLELEFKVKIPADEIGFIAMFLCMNDLTQDDETSKPIIFVAMHGKSTASSMAEVANKLVGGNNVYSYDMNLDKSVKTAYNEIKELIENYHQGAGVIFLVDMGSLGMFGELISEETGIEIKVIDMVSTLLVIECARKSLINNNVDQIWKETKESVSYLSNYGTKLTESYISSKDNIIITICITGEGSAIKLKSMIEERIDLVEKNIQVVPIPVNGKKEMYNTIDKLSRNKKIIAIVGSINPNIYGIPFISISQLFLDENYTKIQQIVNNVILEENYHDLVDISLVDNYDKTLDISLEDYYDETFNVLSKEIKELDMDDFKPLCIKLISKIRNEVTKELDIYIVSGLILHLACALIKMLNRENIPKCINRDLIKSKYMDKFIIVKNLLSDTEDFYTVNFSDDEICNILIIILGIYF